MPMVPSLRSFRSQSRQGDNKDGRTSPAAPSSSAASVTTAASVLEFEGDRLPILTRADLRASVVAFEDLLTSAKAYRNALIALSQATTSFAGALGECARVKGAREANAEQLLAGSGMHYMIANSGQVLSDLLYRTFEVPLMHAFDQYVSAQVVRHREYEELLAQKTAAIRQTEADNLKQGRKRNRDLAQFRKALERLQEQVREVEVCKRAYYGEVLSAETDMWGQIGQKVSLLLRSTLDLADRLASKATSDPVVESMLAEHPDPFDSYRPESEEKRDMFSILPPLGLSSGSDTMKGKAPSALSTPRASHTSQSTAKKDRTVPTAAEVLGITTPSRREASTKSSNEVPSPTKPSRNDQTDPAPEPLSRSPSPSSTTSAVGILTVHDSAHDEEAPTTPRSARSFGSLRGESPRKATGRSASPKKQSSSAFLLGAGKKGHNKRTESRRQLSRVSEAQGDVASSIDSMAGDWGPPLDERSITPSGDGEFSDGEDVVDSHIPRSSSANWLEH